MLKYNITQPGNPDQQPVDHVEKLNYNWVIGSKVHNDLLLFMRTQIAGLSGIGQWIFDHLRRDFLKHGTDEHHPELIESKCTRFVVSGHQCSIDISFSYSYIPTPDDTELNRDRFNGMIDDYKNGM